MHPDRLAKNGAESRVPATRNRGRHARPFQYGLASLLWLTTAVAVAVWLDVPYWLHIGSVFVQILIALVGVSLVGATILAPFAIFALGRWIIEDSNWEMYFDRLRNRLWPSKESADDPDE